MFNAIKPNGHTSEIRIISYDLLIMRNFFLAKSQVATKSDKPFLNQTTPKGSAVPCSLNRQSDP
jgi:hypothetical protein